MKLPLTLILTEKFNGREWSCIDDDYDRLTIHDGLPKPTTEELEFAYEEIKKIAYKKERESEYIERGATEHNLLIALWELIVENRPESAQEMQLIREGVKLEFPKPENV